MSSATRATRGAVTALGVLAALSAGCAVRLERAGSARPVSIGEFSQPPAAPQAPEEAPDIETLLGAGSGQADDVWFDEPFVRTALDPKRPGRPVIVDSLVGHVNGRPIFADEFLLPIEDRLMRAAEELQSPHRELQFQQIINDWLRDVVLNELILAEAEAGLSVEEQRGLFAWLRRTYEEEIRKGGGTRSGAESRRAREGVGLDQYLDRQKDMVLIDQLKGEKIDPRVVVTWRDIEREYERRREQFNRPARVTLARIRVPNSRPDLIEEVRARLEGGEDFAVIAEELGFPDGGRWETFDAGPGGVADINVSDTMKRALEGLREGDTSPPLQLGTATLWLHVVDYEEGESRSIYDPKVQMALKNAIRAQRSNREWGRYIESLLKKGVKDDLDEMADRLLRIAIQRYGQ